MTNLRQQTKNKAENTAVETGLPYFWEECARFSVSHVSQTAMMVGFLLVLLGGKI